MELDWEILKLRDFPAQLFQPVGGHRNDDNTDSAELDGLARLRTSIGSRVASI